MNSPRRIILAALAALSVSLPAGAASQPTNTEREIQFWEGRLNRDPADQVTPTKLGTACIQYARESGNFSYYLKAQSAFEEALRRKPDHYGALVGMASAYAAQHRFKEAQTMAEKALAALPGDNYARGILGDACLEAGDVARAESLYKTLMAAEPGLFSYSRMANLKHIKGDVKGAIALLGKAAAWAEGANAPAESIAWCYTNMGEMNWSSGNWTEAEKYYRKALKITPNGFLPQEHLAELRGAQGKTQEALQRYEQVIKIAPHPDFFEAMADLYAQTGSPAKAREFRMKALDGYLSSVKEGNIGYYRHLAHFYADVAKNPDEAVRWAKKDLEVRQDVHAYGTLAWALYRKGDYAAAAQNMRKALVLNTQDAELFYHAGLIFQRSGDRAAAREYLHRSLQANPRGEDASEARRLLATLGEPRRMAGR